MSWQQFCRHLFYNCGLWRNCFLGRWKKLEEMQSTLNISTFNDAFTLFSAQWCRKKIWNCSKVCRWSIFSFFSWFSVVEGFFFSVFHSSHFLSGNCTSITNDLNEDSTNTAVSNVINHTAFPAMLWKKAHRLLLNGAFQPVASSWNSRSNRSFYYSNAEV